VALAGTVGLSGSAAIMAQDATPAGTPIGPEGVSCFAPSLTALATPAGTPVGDVMFATPATQLADLPEGTVVEDEAIIGEATAAIENFYACFNLGDGTSVVALMTEGGRMAAFGAGSPMMVAEQVTALTSVATAGDIEYIEVVDLGDGRLGVSYQVAIGQQVFNFTDVLVQAGGIYKIDDRRSNTPETDLDSTTAAVRSSMVDGTLVFEIAPNPIMNQPAVNLQLVNEGEESHYLMLFQVPEGFDGSTLLEADFSDLPAGVTFISVGTVNPGDFSITLFEGLDEGSYVITGSAVDISGQPIGVTGWADFVIDPAVDPEA
jgi:hypothetical protein